MGAKRYAKGNKKGSSDIPFLWWLGAAGIALFLLIFPYNKGMFNGYEVSFEQTINSGAIYALLLLLIPALYLIRKWRLDSHVNVLSIAVLFLPLVYWISSFGAVSEYYADYMVIIYVVFAALFLTALYTGGHLLTGKTIEAGLMLSGGIIVLFGLLNLFGQVYSRDAMWLAHDGYRLTSVFQYSNTYAGYLIAIFFASVYYAVQGKRVSTRWIHAAMLAPIWISFMLTYSRGALVVIPVIVLAVLPFLRLSKQIAFILYTGISVLVSLLVLGKISSNAAAIAAQVQPAEGKAVDTISLFSKLPLQSWGLLLLAMAITTALIWLYHTKCDAFVEKKLQFLAKKRWSFILIPAVTVILGALVAGLLLGSPGVRSLLPQQLADRIASINFQQHSVLERITFYKDGLRVSEDYPVIGAGGGAWQAIYEQYQNNPYESRQAHSFYVQVLVEVGWTGLLILLGFIAYVYVLYIKSYIRHPELRDSRLVFFIFSLALLIHSAIDFDLSYVYIGALLFISLGGMIAPLVGLRFKNTEIAAAKASWRDLIYPAVLVLLSLVTLFTVIQNNQAVSIYKKAFEAAVKNTKPFPELIDMLDRSISLAPDQTAYSATKVNWLIQAYEQNNDAASLELALETLQEAEKYDSYSRVLYVYKLRLLELNNGLEDSLPVIEETLIKFPWDITFYEKAITSYANARSNALTAQNSDKAAEYAERMREIAAEVQRRIELLETLPEEQQQGRNFSFTEPMNAALATLD